MLPCTYMSGALLGGNSLKRLLPLSRMYRLSWKSWCSPLEEPGVQEGAEGWGVRFWSMGYYLVGNTTLHSGH